MTEDRHEFQQALDDLLQGTSTGRTYRLTPEEWQRIAVAEELTSLQVAERSEIRAGLKEHLMETITAEQERELAQKKQSNGRPWWHWVVLVLGILFIVGGIIGAIAAIDNSISNAYNRGRSAAVQYATIEAGRAAEDPADNLAPFGENADNVYIVQQPPESTFGGVLRLRDVFVTGDDEGYSRPSGEITVFLTWEVLQALPNPQISVAMDTERRGYVGYQEENTVDVGFPLEAGTVIVTEHRLNDDEGTSIFTLQVIDRATGGPLTLADGRDQLTFSLQPAVTIPSQLVPGDAAPTPSPDMGAVSPMP